MKQLEVDVDAFTVFKSGDLSKPICMLNQLKFRGLALYEPTSSEAPATGWEAYDRYGSGVIPLFQKIGGHVILDGALPLLGPAGEWDRVFVVRYPSRHSFLNMISCPEYAAVVHHRTAAVLDSRVFALDYVEAADRL